MAIVGYARVSRKYGQSLEVQLGLLKEQGCDKVFSEKVSGTTQDRPQLKECLSYVREGDVLVVSKLDRLARSTLHLHQIINDLNEKGVGFRCLQQNIDTTTKEGRLMFSVLSAIATFETELRAERCEEGRQLAIAKGVKFGAPQKLTEDQKLEIRSKQESGVRIAELVKEYKVSRPTIYRILKAA
mgnify:CR=1 FL=1